MTDGARLRPADFHAARCGGAGGEPTVDETVLWYMEIYPDADEDRVRAEITRRAKRGGRLDQ